MPLASIARLCRRALVGIVAAASAAGAGAATVQTFSPQGEVGLVRQVRATFSEPMVAFGDPTLAAPIDVHCDAAAAGVGRWVDATTWVWDFRADLPPGVRCTAVVRPAVRSVAGQAVTGTTRYGFSTGGPSIVRSYPYASNATEIEEQQMFALLLNGAAATDSIAAHAHCEAAGIGERIGVALVTGADRAAVLKAVSLTAQSARAVVLQCARPLPSGGAATLVWDAGIATPSGVATRVPQRLRFKVRPAFTASFTCERVSSRADCLPIRPLRVEFSAPVPKRLAEQAALVGPDGQRRPARLEQHRGEPVERLLSFREGLVTKFLYLFGERKGTVAETPSEGTVSAVEFEAPLPENATVRIELPADLRDDAGRPLSNAGAFPLTTRTAEAPPLVKFAAATFGILELHSEPTLPVTVRHVEGDLATRALTASAATGHDLTVGDDDATVIGWLAKVARYGSGSLPRSEVENELGIRLPAPTAPPSSPRRSRRYGEDVEERTPPDMVETRTVGLLDRLPATRRITLPDAALHGVRPFEVVGIPMPAPGFHVVEIASPRLGAALLDRTVPMYVRTSVLVTDLAVHFKNGVVGSGVWVTSLDSGRPVGGAALQVSDCHGRALWHGTSGADGYAAVEMELPPQRYADCQMHGDTPEDGYFVSARRTDAQGRADMAFVWSTSNQGIESWRFHVPTGRGDDGSDVYASVLDRTLLRAGQTVSMKHYARRELLRGLALVPAAELPGQVRITHVGSGQRFTVDLHWTGGRDADSVFAIPAEAKLGLYQVSLEGAGKEHETATFRVEEFRLPVLSGRIVVPKEPLVQPRELPVGLQVNYTNGGGAAGTAVRVSAQWRATDPSTAIGGSRWPGFSFSPPTRASDAQTASPFQPDYVDEDDASQAALPVDGTQRLVADKLAATLDRNGVAQVALKNLPVVDTAGELLVQASYADPSGEVQTLSRTLPVWPSALVLGVRTENWASVGRSVATQVLALDTAGHPVAGAAVAVRAVARRTTSVRKRIVGGFYAYDNSASDDDLGVVCQGVTDGRGLLPCTVSLATTGEIQLVAEASDAGGHRARAAASVWVTGRGETWFGGDNQDRMDVIPEQRSYEVGQSARFQVRSPFRHATALVAIERNGILQTRTVAIDGRDPTIALPVQADWAPNVFVSVLAVRGRVREVPWYSLFTWGWRAPLDWWHARKEAEGIPVPTAMVDLAKPSFKYGIAEIEVGTAAHRLAVQVTPDRATYPIRATAHVRVQVRLPDGRAPPAGTTVALAAVDEALLELAPNPTWNLLDTMLRRRDYGVETATAQMQVIGKRHYGKKAAPAGGGGGAAPTRELFDTLLAWQPRVVLDAQGSARVDVPLNDALTAFRIVAVADAVTDVSGQRNAALFGTGSASIRSTQDLQIVAGLPPLVREGDRYRAVFNLRNSTPAAVDAVLSAQVGTVTLAPQTLHIAANAATDAGWDVDVPPGVGTLAWTVAADTRAAHDRLRSTQTVREAVPVRVRQATLLQLDRSVTVPIAQPAGALAGADGTPRGGIEVVLRPRLADGLPGVRDYFAGYPFTCLEQRASIALGLRDPAAWAAVVRQLPLYLDEDGLANYFPPASGWRSTGSDTLTAYLLSASDEAVRLGHADLALPDALRTTMENGLVAFVEGRTTRDLWVPEFARNGNLAVRRIAALEALSRSGKVRPRLVDTLDIAPDRWPTGAVIDWLSVLARTPSLPQRDERSAQAEQVLRARLTMQGTRLGFSTERDDSWWWLMVNGDVNANRLLLAVLDRPGWAADLPRLVVGALQRQQNGRWSTTTANAWGSLAVEAFSAARERVPVGGVTRAERQPGGDVRSLDWARLPAGGTLALGWPRAAPAPPGAFGPATASLKVDHAGSGQPWLTLIARAAVPVTVPFSTGLRVAKTVTPVEQAASGAWTRGDVLRVHLDVDAQADATWVVVDDPVPAGATLLGSGLGRDDTVNRSGERQDGRVWLAYEERRFEGFRAYFRYVPKGRFGIDYTVRLNNAGTFGLPATHVEAMYAPEWFGDAPNAPAVVRP